MLKIIAPLLAGAALIVIAGGQSANAEGAVAIGMDNDVAAHGVAMGEGHNYQTIDEAEARALQECRARPNGPTQYCHVVAHFHHQWLAFSLDPAAGTPGVGWAIGDTQSAAEGQALAQCQATSPDNRKPYCEVSSTSQDTMP